MDRWACSTSGGDAGPFWGVARPAAGAARTGEDTVRAGVVRPAARHEKPWEAPDYCCGAYSSGSCLCLRGRP